MKFSIFLSLLLTVTSAQAAYEDVSVDNSTHSTAQYVGDLDDNWDIHIFGVRGEFSALGVDYADDNATDFYSFDVSANTTLRINVLTPFGPETDTDPMLGLFDSTGALLKLDDDSHSHADGLDSFISYHIMSAGRYSIAVTGYDVGDIGDFSSLHGDTDFLYVAEITTVPVPAAVWLFGSALISLVTFGRRKIA